MRWTPEVVVTVIVRLGGLLGMLWLAPGAFFLLDEGGMGLVYLASAAACAYLFFSGRWVIKMVLAGLTDQG